VGRPTRPPPLLCAHRVPSRHVRHCHHAAGRRSPQAWDMCHRDRARANCPTAQRCSSPPFKPVPSSSSGFSPRAWTPLPPHSLPLQCTQTAPPPHLKTARPFRPPENHCPRWNWSHHYRRSPPSGEELSVAPFSQIFGWLTSPSSSRAAGIEFGRCRPREAVIAVETPPPRPPIRCLPGAAPLWRALPSVTMPSGFPFHPRCSCHCPQYTSSIRPPPATVPQPAHRAWWPRFSARHRTPRAWAAQVVLTKGQAEPRPWANIGPMPF
jgi:hypothetical protein